MIQLFLIFAAASAFTFGGGYAMIPLLSKVLVPDYLASEEMANMVALAQMTPGAVGLNAATYVGFRQFSLLGAIVCTCGLITPCLIIATCAAIARNAVQNSLIYKACLRGIRPMVIGLIASVVLFFAEKTIFSTSIQTLWKQPGQFSIQWQGALIFAVVLFCQMKFKLNVIILTLIAGSLGALLFSFS